METIKKIVFFSLLALLSCTVTGQDGLKKELTQVDYRLWSTVVLKDISNQGNWISYLLRYDSTADTLLIHNKTRGTQISFPNAQQGKFAKEKVFICLTKDKTVISTNLKTGKKRLVKHVESFDLNTNEEWMITVENIENEQRLCVRDLSGELHLELKNLINFQINNNKDKIVFTQYINQNFLSGIVDVKNRPFVKIICKSNLKIDGYKWSLNDAHFAFYEHQAGKTLNVGIYDLKLQTLKLLNQKGIALFTKRAICNNSDIPLQITADGKKVFFGTELLHFVPPKMTAVELWKGSAPYLYPLEQMAKSYNKPYLSVWNTTNDSVFSLSDSTMPKAKIVNSGLQVLTANPAHYEPQYALFPKMDYYLKDVSSATSVLFASSIGSKDGEIDAAPDAGFIAYYKDKNWWMYTIDKKEHINLTKAIGVIWDNSEFDPGDELSVYGIAGWSYNNEVIYIYDRYDIWAFSCDGRFKKRLTSGRAHQKQYRLTNHNRQSQKGLDFGTNVTLSVVNYQEATSGFVIRKADGTMVPLAIEKSYISNLKKAADKEVYAYISEKYDVSPTLFVKSAGLPPVKMLSTNKQQKHYFWGKSELITHQDKNGNHVKGALFYPANYNKDLKYPMVVYIYDRLSHLTHQYVNPSKQAGYGFNTTNFTTNGYFVLMPDILFEIGNTGISATECVLGAVQKVIEKGLVDPAKIGIYGHSFGGYETNFITTQTHLFAAAVSGAGVADTQQHYFTLNSEMLNAEAWRYENQQYRMGYSFYERQDLYLKNSPLINAASITTPLLIWSGAEDQNVKTTQSITFFIALKRLNKKCALLIYPNEGHILLGTEAKKDLNDRVMQWFDHYLKNEKTNWITESTEEK